MYLSSRVGREAVPLWIIIDFLPIRAQAGLNQTYDVLKINYILDRSRYSLRVSWQTVWNPDKETTTQQAAMFITLTVPIID